MSLEATTAIAADDGEQRLRSLASHVEVLWTRVADTLTSAETKGESQYHHLISEHMRCELQGSQPLAVGLTELRRWHAMQRSAHDHQSTRRLTQQEKLLGDLQWKLFCARFCHEAVHNNVRVVPLPQELPWQREIASLVKATSAPLHAIRAAAFVALPPETTALDAFASRQCRALTMHALVPGELCRVDNELQPMLRRLCEAAASMGPAPPRMSPILAPRSPRLPAHGTRAPTPLRQRSGSEGASCSRADDGGCSARSELTPSPTLSAVTRGAQAPARQRQILPRFPINLPLCAHSIGWLLDALRSHVCGEVFYLTEEFETRVSLHAFSAAEGWQQLAHAPLLAAWEHGGGEGGPLTRSLRLPVRVVSPREAACYASPPPAEAAPDTHPAAAVAADADMAETNVVELPRWAMAGEVANVLELHLRPASVEHLLAVEAVRVLLNPIEHAELRELYTPRFPHAVHAATLYVVVTHLDTAAGNAAASSAVTAAGPEAGTSARGDASGDPPATKLAAAAAMAAVAGHVWLRPLQQRELLALAALYILRSSEILGAVDALDALRVLPPLRGCDHSTAARTTPQHLYCALAPAATGSGGSAPGGVVLCGSVNGGVAGSGGVPWPVLVQLQRLKSPRACRDMPQLAGAVGLPAAIGGSMARGPWLKFKPPSLVHMICDGSMQAQLHTAVEAPTSDGHPLGTSPVAGEHQVVQLLTQATLLLRAERQLCSMLRQQLTQE